MSMWRKALFRWRRGELERDLAEEMEFHRSLKLVVNGDARLTDQEMGNLALAKEESRDMWSFVTLERLWQDLRFSVRMLRSHPAFTIVAAVSLALGVGGSAAVFSLMNALLIRPLPYKEPDRLVRVTGVYPKAGLVYFQEQSRTLELATVSPGFEFNLTGRGEAMRVFGAPASANLFSLLGAPMARGRGFVGGEELPGRDAVIVLSHALWQTAFGGDEQILGRVITVNEVDRRVVGVTAAGFAYPSARVRFWIPARIDPSIFGDYWGGEYRPLIGRLRPGATLAQARAEVPNLMTALLASFPFPMPRNFNAGATAIPLHEDLFGNARSKLLILFGSVAALLLIACTNVASLLLARAADRRKEMALRAALGAGRARIVRQLLTESVLLAVVGGGLGVLLAASAISIFRSVLPADLPGLAAASMDFQVLGFAAGLAILTGLVFGLAPAISASRIDLTESIKTGGQHGASRGSMSARSWLIAGEIALTLVLVVAAGLLTKSLYALSQSNPGFRAERLLTIQISPNPSFCKERAACIAFYGELVRRAREIPGVSAAALSNTIPLDGRFAAAVIPVDVEDRPRSADFPSPLLLSGAVTSDFLPMMGTPILRGRGFTEGDGPDASPVILISAATANLLWPGENPLGKHIKTVNESRWRTVIGVVADVRHFSLALKSVGGINGTMYMPYAQAVQADTRLPAVMKLIVKTSADPVRIGGELRALAMAQGPNIPVSAAETMEGIVAASIVGRRSTAGLFLAFALAAAVLAAVGIYGVISHSVSQRTYEIGVRMAIGASKQHVLSMVLTQGLRFVSAGLGLGILAAIGLTRFLSSQLYEVSPTDPLTFAFVSALLLAIAIVSNGIPAWRASRIDPTKSLRVD